MIKKQNILLIGVIVAVITILIAVFFIVQNNRSDKNSDKSQASNNTPAQEAHPSEPAKSPEAPTAKEGTTNKRACELMSDEFAAKIIGEGAVKNDKLPSINNAEYSSNSCEYNAGNKKATLTLYKYPDEQRAAAAKDTVQKQVIVPSADGKTTSTQPRQSAASVKGQYVITATVVTGTVFNSDSSNQLLNEAISKL